VISNKNRHNRLAARQTGLAIDTGVSFDYHGGMKVSLRQKALIITTMHGVVG
jgi:hypothetical protein